MAWARHEHGMASVDQTRPHCVNQMGKTHSNPLAARHGRRMAWARHALCEWALTATGVYPFHEYNEVNSETIPQSRPRPHPSTYFLFFII